MPSHISSTPPPGGCPSSPPLDVSTATPSTVIDATSRLRLDDSLDSVGYRIPRSSSLYGRIRTVGGIGHEKNSVVFVGELKQ